MSPAVADNSSADPQRNYLRFPHLHGDLVTFVARDDVWIAPVTGGRAWQLSSDAVPVNRPRISPDGTLVAWSSTRDGAAEVHVVEIDGGVSRRLTYWGRPTTRVLGWTGDGRVLVASDYGHATRDDTSAYAVPLDGGPAELLPYGHLSEVAVAATGGVLTATSTFREAAYWKRYRGGTAAKLWLDRDGSGHYDRLLPDVTAGLESPMWLDDGRIAFVSDLAGPAAVYTATVPDGGLPAVDDLVKHTAHEFYARHASTDGTRIVYQSGGDLWLLDDLAGSGAPIRIDVTLGGARTARAPHPVPAGDHLGQVGVSWDGRASVVEVRGSLSWVTHRSGPALAVAAGSAVRRRLPTVLGRDGALAWITDAEGDDAVEIGSKDGGTTRLVAAGQLGRVLDLAAAPDGATVAVASHDGVLRVIDLAAGTVREIDRTRDGDVAGLAFSPDSRWLAWSHPGEEPLAQIRLVEVADPAAEPIEVTPLRFSDSNPVFSLDGKHLAFLSVRSFDPVYDAFVFDLSFPNGCRPQLVPLAATTPSPFDPVRDGRPVGKPDDDSPAEAGASDPAASDAAASDATKSAAAGTGTPSAKAKQPPATTVDVDGLQHRVVPFPVPAARYSSLRAVKDGFVWLRSELVGELGDDLRTLDDERPRPRLEHYDLGKDKAEELADGVDRIATSGDGERIVLVDKGELRVVPADHPVPDEEADKSDDVVKVDLDRVRVTVDPGAEWRQGFDETGRLMRDHFWRADMNGVDWDGVLARYRPLVDRVGTKDDFIDLLWETIAELGTSHAYARPKPTPPARVQGLLGADLVRDGDRWRIGRILPGEPSEPRARSPLTAPGAAVGAGDAILAVDGTPVDPVAGPGPLLVDTAGKPVELTVAPAGGGTERRIVVVPIADESPLRYQDRVAARRARVHELSGGRLGYLHVPDMVSTGWAQLHRDLRVEIGRDGVIFDLRGNGGGHTSELVVEKLARQVLGWTTARGYEPTTYPTHTRRGTMVTLTDEYAGSDGDIATAAIKALELGPVVGTRTWGGVVGIDGRYDLVDGTMVTQPRFSFWLRGQGWEVENHGVDPDVEVFYAPHDVVSGTDPQLERGVELALERLAAQPAVTPPELPPAGRGDPAAE